jgi:predicted DsbA family dithiol-disulfide isomerase
MAFASPQITAACIEATEFMDLSRKFRVTGVPKTIVNGKTEIMGAVPENPFVKTVVEAAKDTTVGPTPTQTP